MKIEFWMVGKTSFPYLNEGVPIYEKRITRYIPFQSQVIPDIKNAKNMPAAQLKEKEGQAILDKLNKEDFLILLDEKGKSFSSVAFAQQLDQYLLRSNKRLIFLIGGAFGFSEAVYARANQKISLSKMTFSHQMIRLFFVEQLYRAFSILRKEPYHNE